MLIEGLNVHRIIWRLSWISIDMMGAMRNYFYRSYWEDLLQKKEFVIKWHNINDEEPQPYQGDPNTYAEIDILKLYNHMLPDASPATMSPDPRPQSTLQMERQYPEKFVPTSPDQLSSNYGSDLTAPCYISVRDYEVIIDTDFGHMSRITTIIRNVISTYPRTRGASDRLYPNLYTTIPKLGVSHILYSVPMDNDPYQIIIDNQEKISTQPKSITKVQGILEFSISKDEILPGIHVWHNKEDADPRMFIELRDEFTQNELDLTSSATWELGVGVLLAILQDVQSKTKDTWIHEHHQETLSYVNAHFGPESFTSILESKNA
ncbi:MAG: hypothetical protein ACW98K_13285 [Candidatus Kariarchaeaceae archaeon]|jgi:hypothetical protein